MYRFEVQLLNPKIWTRSSLFRLKFISYGRTVIPFQLSYLQLHRNFELFLHYATLLFLQAPPSPRIPQETFVQKFGALAKIYLYWILPFSLLYKEVLNHRLPQPNLRISGNHRMISVRHLEANQVINQFASMVNRFHLTLRKICHLLKVCVLRGSAMARTLTWFLTPTDQIESFSLTKLARSGWLLFLNKDRGKRWGLM